MVRRSVLIGSTAAAGAVLLRRARSRRARDADAAERLATPVAADQARSLVEAVLGRRPARRPLTIDFAPAVATDWELLIDGPSFFPRMLADIEAAKTDVHILIFGFKAGEIGHTFRDLLIKKVEEGVAVRLSVEAGYSQPGLGSKVLYQALTAGGVQVVANQGAFLDLDGLLGERRIDWRFDDFLHFDHRKVIVIDGRVAFVGGPGIEDHYADDRFHDVMLRLEGPVVAQVQAAFLLSWHFQGGPLPDTAAGLDRFFPPPPSGDGFEVEVLMNNPGERHLPIAKAFREAVASATRRLYVVNPYLADRGILRGLVEAAERGVDVRVIVPADPHSMPASRAVRHWFGPMLAAGVDLREHPAMAHAKVVLSDDTVLAGTANLDALSLRQNWEVQLRIHDAGFADHVAAELFDRDVEVTTPAQAPTSPKDRVLNAIVSRAAPVL